MAAVMSVYSQKIATVLKETSDMIGSSGSRPAQDTHLEKRHFLIKPRCLRKQERENRVRIYIGRIGNVNSLPDHNKAPRHYGDGVRLWDTGRPRRCTGE